jgi:hypothetical protein
MNPKEKARELVDKFYQFFPLNKDVNTTDGKLSWEYNDWGQAKQCALIAVDEIINSDWFIPTKEDLNAWKNYWEQVKQEIINL